MSLFVESEDRAWEILERLRARIFGARSNIRSNGKAERGTQPRVQRLRFNAKKDDYRRPEVASTGFDGYTVAAGSEYLSVAEEGWDIGALNGDSVRITKRPYPYPPDIISEEVVASSPGDSSGIPLGGSGVRYGYQQTVRTDTASTVEISFVFALPVKGKTHIYCRYRRLLQSCFIYTNKNYRPRYLYERRLDGTTSVLLNSIDEASASVSSYDYVDLVDLFCVLVTPFGVRQVPAPEILKTKLKALIPIEYVPPGVVTTVVQVGNGFDNRDTDGSDLNSRGTTPTNDYSVRQPTFFPTNYSFRPLHELPMAKLGFTGSNTYEHLFGPGIYSLINSPELFNDQSIGATDMTSPEGWNLLVSKLPDVKPYVALAPCALDGTCLPDRIGFDLQRAPSVVVLPPSYDRNKSADIKVADPSGPVGPDYPTFFSWDWGQPGYCMLKLQGLGFQPEDLVLDLPGP